MTNEPDFDAEDLVNAILGVEPAQKQPVESGFAAPPAAASAVAKPPTSSSPSATPPVATPRVATPPSTPTRSTSPHGAYVGWLLLAALILAVSVAVSLAIQLDSDASPNPPRCGGLYSQCCEDWDDNSDDCPDNRERDNDECTGLYSDDDDPSSVGLFDSEEHFADC